VRASGEPLFVARRRYRLRRARDAARLLPVIGLVLFMLVPLRSAVGEAPLVGQLVYVFGVWAGLIVVALVLSRHLSGALPEAGEAQGEAGDDRL